MHAKVDGSARGEGDGGEWGHGQAVAPAMGGSEVVGGEGGGRFRGPGQQGGGWTEGCLAGREQRARGCTALLIRAVWVGVKVARWACASERGGEWKVGVAGEGCHVAGAAGLGGS